MAALYFLGYLMNIFRLLILALLCSCASTGNWKRDSDFQPLKIANEEELGHILARWNSQKTESYIAKYQSGSWVSVRILEISVKNGKVFKALRYRLGSKDEATLLSEKEASRYAMESLFKFASQNIENSGYTFYTNQSMNLLVGYSWSNPDPRIEDDWGSITLEEINW
jgi:hypothetical protein